MVIAYRCNGSIPLQEFAGDLRRVEAHYTQLRRLFFPAAHLRNRIKRHHPGEAGMM